MALFLAGLGDLGEGGDRVGVVQVGEVEGVVVEAVDDEADDEGQEGEGKVEGQLAVIDFVAHQLILI